MYIDSLDSLLSSTTVRSFDLRMSRLHVAYPSGEICYEAYLLTVPADIGIVPDLGGNIVNDMNPIMLRHVSVCLTHRAYGGHYRNRD
jgi:hypothetical protein